MALQEKKVMNIDLKTILTIIGIICAGLFWIYTMTSIPQRVQILESKIEVIEKSIVKNETQTELILNAMYEIRNNVQNITLNMKSGSKK